MSGATKLSNWLDNGSELTSKNNRNTWLGDDRFYLGGNVAATPDWGLGWNTAQTVDALYLGLSAGQNTFVIAEYADRTFDFAHGAQTNPTLFIHSAAQSTTEFSRWNAGSVSFGLGIAVVGTEYMIGRDADATNQLHFNVPTGASFEWSVNDVAQTTLNINGFDTVKRYTATIADTTNLVAMSLTQNDTTNNPNVLNLTNAGTGNGLFIDQNGNGISINIDTESTTANGMTLAADVLSTGYGLSITSASTAGNAYRLLNIDSSGANAVGGITRYGLYSNMTGTGATSTNIALGLASSGATTNWAVYQTTGDNAFNATSGFTHFGSANTNWRTDFPFAQIVSSQADTGQTDPNNIGVLGEATGADGKTGIGLRGFGKTNGVNHGQGFQGIVTVTNAADTGIAYGGVVQSNSVHTGADNIGLYVSATNASGSGENIALQIVAGLFKDNLLYRQHASQSLADDAQIAIKTGTAGYGFAQIGDNQEWAHFTWATSGVVTLTNNSANVVNTDTDTKFCIYDAGAGIAIKNRLGAALTLRYAINYS